MDNIEMIGITILALVVIEFIMLAVVVGYIFATSKSNDEKMIINPNHVIQEELIYIKTKNFLFVNRDFKSKATIDGDYILCDIGIVEEGVYNVVYKNANVKGYDGEDNIQLILYPSGIEEVMFKM